MTALSAIPLWAVSFTVFTAIALFFRFALTGYDYMAYTFGFFAVLTVLHRFLPAGIRRWVTVLVGIGFVYFCVLEVMILRHSRGDKHRERKYIIVLGSKVKGELPSPALRHRLEGALDYVNQHPHSTAILSGGRGSDEGISEALCMYRWLVEHGVEPGRLIMEDRSATTMENLVFSFEIIRSRGDEPDGNIALVSSAYHLCRAKQMAKMLGASAVGVAGNPGYPVYMLNCYIREAFALTHLWVFGY